MIRRPPRSTLSSSSAASDVYKRQFLDGREPIGGVEPDPVDDLGPERHELVVVRRVSAGHALSPYSLGRVSGWATATTSRPSIPEKSLGLQVYRGSSLARAASASKGSGSKSASACWRWARRAARSVSLAATSGPTDSSARVIVEISGASGSTSGSRRRGSRMA